MTTAYLVQADFKDAVRFAENTYGKGFVFEFDYVSANSTFREINRFLWESRKSQRYKNRYDGPVTVNLTKWSSKHLNEYFHAFMYMLQDYEYECCFITEVHPKEDLIKAIEKHFENVKIKNMLPEEKVNKTTIGFAITEGKEDVRE